MSKPIFTGKIIKGKFWLDDRKTYDSYVASLGEGDYRIAIEKRRKLRTTGKDLEKSNQNGYYWGVVIPKLVEYYDQQAQKEDDNRLRMSPDQIHEGIKFLFMNEGMMSHFPKIKSTKGMNTLEWEELMRQIREWAAEELHLYIPEPMEE